MITGSVNGLWGVTKPAGANEERFIP